MDEFVTSLEAATDARGVKVVCKVYHSPRALSAMMTDGGDASRRRKKAEVTTTTRAAAAAPAGGGGGGSKRPTGSNSNSVMMMVHDGGEGSSSYYNNASTSSHHRYQGGGLTMTSAAADDTGVSSNRARLDLDDSTEETSHQQYVTEQVTGSDEYTIAGGEEVVLVESADDLPPALEVVPPTMDYRFDVNSLSWPQIDDDWVPTSDYFDFDATDDGVVQKGGDQPTAAI
ncbi:hypothetical protein PR202_gb00593 [Eleusine coracana subsp. coracana]|uniref:Uncharacterized protein n=1 Tax=Eleusine coracana subsp. coracana TaxID=191504 RepID=A0AAV5DUH7_ELECO|nr:hypothetical protein PR202_gb00593 [Eleusine coracana subsp. coracana]